MDDNGHPSAGCDMAVVDAPPGYRVSDGNDDLGVRGIYELHSQDGVVTKKPLDDRVVDEPDDGKPRGDGGFCDDQSVATGSVNDE